MSGEKRSVHEENIDQILANSCIQEQVFFGKAIVLACQLPNGFILVGVGACVDPDTFNYRIGYDVAMKDILNQLWRMEGYLLQHKISLEKLEGE